MARFNRTAISRRTVLRGMMAGGASVAVPLPRLGGMLNSNGTAFAAGGALPVRFGTWFFGNGIIPSRWVPTKTGVGSEWTLSEQLSPLLEVKPWISVVTGLNIKGPDISAHQSHPVQVLTGGNTGGGIVQLPTIDQQVAAALPKAATFPSGLHVGICSTGGGTGQGINLSYSGPSAPNPPNLSPTKLFMQLVQYASTGGGGTPKPADPELLRRRMVLDAVAEDAKALRTRLGVDDRQRLDRHLSGVQQLQAQITQIEMPRMTGTIVDPDKAYAKRGADGSVTRLRCQAFADLLVFALAGDLTRVFSFAFTSPACHGQYGDCGLSGSFHEDYGHRNSPRGYASATEGFNTGIKFTLSCLTDMLVKMRDTPDGAGNLLDNSAIFTSSCVSESSTHSGVDFPILISGKAGGKLRGDIHFRQVGENVSKAGFTLMQAMGTNVTSFGKTDGLVSSGIPDLLA
jgi:hypothetical protein